MTRKMKDLKLDIAVDAKVREWLGGSYDEETRQEIQHMIEEGKKTELSDAFYKDLAFGTGGIRGIMGVGSNRINKYTLGKATQGLCNYLKRTYPNEFIKVVIAHDNRNHSEEFARLTAEVFSANGIKVYFFESLRPTPELSFAIRELGCKSGVMLTASHNPKEYNGYKAYGPDGGQLVSPHDQNVMDEVARVNSISDIKFRAEEHLIQEIGAAIDEKYYAALTAQSLSKEAIARQADMKIVYSPIHGTGGVSVPPVLKRFGFKNVILVEEQMTFDGDFPTVVYPNPEEKEALTLALKKAVEHDAELVMATDPDADRVGIAIRNPAGKFELLNGNQTATLLIDYLLKKWKENGKLQGKEYIVKTIVTSFLLDKIAEEYQVQCFNTLTGFKYIGEIMTQLEGQMKFIGGGEESYGYLVGEHARDKDAVVSCAMIAEMAAYYKDMGSTLYDALIDIYLNFGLFKEKLISVTKQGKKGAEEISAMMNKFRNEPPVNLGGSKVIMIKDYHSSLSINPLAGTSTTIDLPKSNVLQFLTEDGSIISARPSGTEPKIKFYCSVNAELKKREDYIKVGLQLDEKLDQIFNELNY
jgi:phosphoglucomutase